MKFVNEQQVADLLSSTKGPELIKKLDFWQGRAVIIVRAVITRHVNDFEAKVNCGEKTNRKKLLTEINDEIQEKLLLSKGCEGLDDNFINASIKHSLEVLGY